MGALHEGHAALIRSAARSGRPVLVSIFVNPTQFGPSEDFSRYPRTLDADLLVAEQAGAGAAFFPSVADIYPSGIEVAHQEAAHLELPAVATVPRLEDALRPGHFAGVCQVVARLFDLCKPGRAYFGEKDFQQLLVIESMVESSRGRWAPLQIERCATVREGDGLAMSSRNRFLSSADRQHALGLHRALHWAQSHAAALRTDRSGGAELEAGMLRILAESAVQTQYAAVRDATSLQAPSRGTQSVRALIAAKVGTVRLIDNVALTADLGD